MLAAVTASKLSVRVAQRAVVVAGRRQAAVQAVRRREVRGVQTVAQTDRVSVNISYNGVHLAELLTGYYNSPTLLIGFQA